MNFNIFPAVVLLFSNMETMLLELGGLAIVEEDLAKILLGSEHASNFLGKFNFHQK